MNYLAHGHLFIDRPYVLAGTAVPDWLRVSDRLVRVRSKSARPYVAHEDPIVADVAQGICRHHRDDDLFHNSPAFLELSWQLTVRLRERLGRDDGFRPSFVGHILVEILLDALLISDDPGLPRAYYAAMAALSPDSIMYAVNCMAPRSAVNLASLIPRFCRDQFLYDYLEDASLLGRLNMVMRRVGLPALPDATRELFGEARDAVRERRDRLLHPPLRTKDDPTESGNIVGK